MENGDNKKEQPTVAPLYKRLLTITFNPIGVAIRVSVKKNCLKYINFNLFWFKIQFVLKEPK